MPKKMKLIYGLGFYNVYILLILEIQIDLRKKHLDGSVRFGLT